MKVFVSWSGGKDTILALYKVMQNPDIEVAYLLNMVSQDGRRSRSHGVSSKILKLQAEAIGIPIVQRRTTWQTYEEEYKKAISDFKKENIGVGVFGDIDVQEHRDWVERVCKDMGIKPILPLWKEKRERLLKEFIHKGFKAKVISVRVGLLDKGWLGRSINEDFIRDLKVMNHIDLCGENGEYHTFVYDGPIFKRKINILQRGKIRKDKHWFLKLLPK